MRRAAVVAAGLVALAAGCGGSKTVTVTTTRTLTTTRTFTQTQGPPATASPSACTASQLDGTFAVVRGSAGAGQISYALTLTNTSQTACFVSGLPQAQLLAADGSALPTHVTAAHPGQGAAAKIVLQPGDAAKAEARFSPDVPGTGDRQAPGVSCQPKAATLRVTLSTGGTVDAPVQPPTSVCEQGSLHFDLLASAS